MTQPDPTAEDASAHLARMAARTSYDDLPESVVTAAKWGILDTLGVSLAATGMAAEYLAPVRAFLDRTASPGPTPALALGRRLHPLDAMFWHGALAHTLDYDDLAGYSHPSGPVVTAALPIAQLTGPVDGRTAITAVALGQDTVVRIAQALRQPISDHGWMPSLPGVFGAAVTTAKLLGLDAARTRDALGLTLHQASGTMQALARQGSAYRAIREAFNARAGAVAALLAADGLPGDQDGLEGQYGLFPLFCDGDYDPAFLRRDDLLGSRIAFKPWPCAGHPQLFLTGLDRLLREEKPRPEDVAVIRIAGCSELLPHQCAPLADRAAPRHSIDAKVSIPFLLGKLLLHGTITIQDFTPDGLRDAAATELARLVQWRLDPSLRRDPNGFGTGVVELDLRDGRTLRAEVDNPLGHPDNPLSWDDIVAKFHRCVEASAAAIPRSAADHVVATVAALESTPDITTLLNTLHTP